MPAVLRRRLLALRAYDADGATLVGADIVEGTAFEPLAKRLFEDRRTDRVDVHYARTGCWGCSLVRAAQT